jgi:hypothetical protein
MRVITELLESKGFEGTMVRIDLTVEYQVVELLHKCSGGVAALAFLGQSDGLAV